MNLLILSASINFTLFSYIMHKNNYPTFEYITVLLVLMFQFFTLFYYL